MATPPEKYSKYHVYPPIYPNIEDWPIYKLSEDRTAFIEEINDLVFDKLTKKKSVDDVNDLIAKTIYNERIRIKEEPWKVDPPNDKQFWNKIRSKLIKKSLDKEEEQSKAVNEQLLKRIINRYSEEIVGTFKISTFQFARRFLTFFFNRLLNTAANRNIRRITGTGLSVTDRLKAVGEVDKFRNLFNKGTVVIVPTHFSNIDSILIGYMLDAVVGAPSFSYGAGLNLYNTGYTAYFMNRLGAYRLDRRKKNPIYLETLKGMSTLSIQRGVNSLFFPGGTRSRSGSLEKKLKLGLMGTVIEAQRSNFEKGKNEKIFVVPMVMSYHFVLEAKFLIEDYLRRTGQEHYLQSKDQSYSLRKNLKFIWQIFRESSEITVSFGKPMDVLGNFVDMEGKSTDQHGNELHIRDYFLTNGKIKPDLQREAEYTRILGTKLVERFHKDNVVLSSHLVAYAAFNLLRNEHPKLDIFGILRLPPDDIVFDSDLLLNVVHQLKIHLIEEEKAGNIKLSKPIHWEETSRLLYDGVKQLGNFHAQKPLIYNKKGDIVSENLNILFFYHNRLENYDLRRVINFEESLQTFANF